MKRSSDGWMVGRGELMVGMRRPSRVSRPQVWSFYAAPPALTTRATSQAAHAGREGGSRALPPHAQPGPRRYHPAVGHAAASSHGGAPRYIAEARTRARSSSRSKDGKRRKRAPIPPPHALRHGGARPMGVQIGRVVASASPARLQRSVVWALPTVDGRRPRAELTERICGRPVKARARRGPSRFARALSKSGSDEPCCQNGEVSYFEGLPGMRDACMETIWQGRDFSSHTGVG